MRVGVKRYAKESPEAAYHEQNMGHRVPNIQQNQRHAYEHFSKRIGTCVKSLVMN